MSRMVSSAAQTQEPSNDHRPTRAAQCRNIRRSQHHRVTPRHPKKPIVLIGGLNGAGQDHTSRSHPSRPLWLASSNAARKSGSYENYLRGLIHRRSARKRRRSTRMTFHAHQEGVEREYWIRRAGAVPAHPSARPCSYLSTVRHDEALTSTWNEHIEAFPPRGIAGLFFFDGEQIEALADLDRSQEVLSSALASLMGIELVDRLVDRPGRTAQATSEFAVPDELRDCYRRTTGRRHGCATSRGIGVTARRRTAG